MLWSLDLTLWLSPRAYAPHVTHPLTEEKLFSHSAPAPFDHHPLWAAPVGTGVPATASREIPVSSGQMGEKVPQDTFPPLFLALFDLLQNAMSHSGSLRGRTPRSPRRSVPPRSLKVDNRWKPVGMAAKVQEQVSEGL